ncbi:helix-turn-helix domain-containing protein [Vibrio paucivorans]
MAKSLNGRTKLHKVALTKKIEQTEKQLIVSQGIGHSHPLVEGHFVSYDCPGAYTIHGGQSSELVDSNVVSTAPAAVLVTILLYGKLQFSYDELSFDLDATHGPQGVIVNLTRPANFVRNIRHANQLAKINISLQPNWVSHKLGEDCEMRTFTSAHKNHQHLHITPTLKLLTEQIVSSKKPSNFGESLQLETLSHAALAEIVGQLTESQKVAPKTDPQENTQSTAEDIISFIETNLSSSLSLEHIAAHFSMSVSNLQRKFKAAIGLTINGYIRHRRLEVAKQHLEKGLVSITEAAYEAGYYHPSNFTNAFKKVFGAPPTNFLRSAE